MKKLVGHVTPQERDEIQALHERKIALGELANVLSGDNVDLYERLVKDTSETTTKFSNWWDAMALKYHWESAEGGNWTIDFNDCTIYLVTPE